MARILPPAHGRAVGRTRLGRVAQGTAIAARHRGRLSLVTFFGGTKKVTRRRGTEPPSKSARAAHHPAGVTYVPGLNGWCMRCAYVHGWTVFGGRQDAGSHIHPTFPQERSGAIQRTGRLGVSSRQSRSYAALPHSVRRAGIKRCNQRRELQYRRATPLNAPHYSHATPHQSCPSPQTAHPRSPAPHGSPPSTPAPCPARSSPRRRSRRRCRRNRCGRRP